MPDFQSPLKAFRTFLEASPDAFMLFSPECNHKEAPEDFVLLFMNQAAGKMVRKNPGAVIGRRMSEILPEQKGTCLSDACSEVYLTGKACEFETPYGADTDEEEKWFSVSITTAEDYLAVHAQDITERKKAEAELKQSEERFRTLADNISQFAWMADENGRGLWYNKRMYEYTGQTFEELQGVGWKNLHHPDYLERSSKMFFDALKKGEAWEDTFPLRSKDGHYRWFLSRALPIKDASGKIALWFGTNTDITEHKEYEERLQKSEESYRRLTEELKRNQMKYEKAEALAHVGGWVTDVKTGVMDISDELKKIIGIDLSVKNITLKEYLKFTHPDDFNRVERTAYESHKAGLPVDIEYRIIRSDGEIRYIHGLSGAEPGLTRIRFGAAMDVTESVKQQEILKQTLNKLEQSNEELKQFAYVASHDLQEPLRMVSSYMGLLEKKYKDGLDEKAKMFISYAVDGSNRMSNLIKDLLAYSRINSQANKFQETDLNKVIAEVKGDLQVLIKETNANVTSVTLPSVSADPTQMHQLFQNLIGNAIKFQNDSRPEVFINAERIDRGWLFSVNDNGIGIDPQYYKRIFAVFQRLHDRGKYEGTGIGLAVCKKIVERHGGSIWVKSQEGKGSTFYFTISE